mgnify:CR=1 FL=1
MKSKYGKVKRPLLKISKLRIEEYAQQNSIPYRDDLTNFENDYNRNFIRNEIIQSYFISCRSSGNKVC